jgi:predicted transcriptional regulator
MNLADMLSYADISQLNRIANHYECNCNSRSKRELIQSILHCIHQRATFEQTIGQFSLSEIRFLHSIQHERKDTFSIEDLLAKAQLSQCDKTSIGPEQVANKLAREMISKFSSLGWLFQGYSQNTRYLYRAPHDLLEKFNDVLNQNYQSQLIYLEQAPPAYRDEQQLLSEDMIHFLHFLHQNKVELTMEGAMYKKFQQILLDTLHIKEELVHKGDWRFGYGRKVHLYPHRLSLIYDYCYAQNWIKEENNLLQLTDRGSKFLHLNKKPEPHEIFIYWLYLYRKPIFNLKSLIIWISKLAYTWVTLDSLNLILTPLMRPFYYDSPQSILHQRIIKMLLHQGILRIGEHPSHGTVIEITKMGAKLINQMNLHSQR